MPSIQTIRNDLDNALQAKQSLMSVSTYNKYWRLVAENWDDKEELGKLYTKINKIKQSKVSKLKQELKALRDAGEINPNVKLNQSEAKLRDIYNNHYLSKFDNDAFFVKPKTKPALTEVKSFKNTVQNIIFENNDDVEWGFSSFCILNYTIPSIRKAMKDHHNVKLNFNFTFIMEHKDVKGVDEENFVEVSHSSTPQTLFNVGEIQDCLSDVITETKNWITEFQERETGKIFRYVKLLSLGIGAYKPLRAGSYIPLDEFLSNKKCCINIQNEDEKCLMYCVLYHFNQKSIKKDPQRVSKYKSYENQFDFSSIKFPASLHEVKKLEKIIDYRINVFY